MAVIERLTATKIQLRSPPVLVMAAHETATHHTKALRASSRSILLRFAAEQIASPRVRDRPFCASVSSQASRVVCLRFAA